MIPTPSLFVSTLSKAEQNFTRVLENLKQQEAILKSDKEEDVKIKAREFIKTLRVDSDSYKWPMVHVIAPQAVTTVVVSHEDKSKKTVGGAGIITDESYVPDPFVLNVP
jgi:hypothetical protein